MIIEVKEKGAAKLKNLSSILTAIFVRWVLGAIKVFIF